MQLIDGGRRHIENCGRNVLDTARAGAKTGAKAVQRWADGGPVRQLGEVGELLMYLGICALYKQYNVNNLTAKEIDALNFGFIFIFTRVASRMARRYVVQDRCPPVLPKLMLTFVICGSGHVISRAIISMGFENRGLSFIRPELKNIISLLYSTWILGRLNDLPGVEGDVSSDQWSRIVNFGLVKETLLARKNNKTRLAYLMEPKNESRALSLINVADKSGTPITEIFCRDLLLKARGFFLIMCVRNDLNKKAKKLIEAGRAAGIDVLGTMLTRVHADGLNALRLAVMGGNSEIVQQLLESGAEDLAGEGVLGTMLTTAHADGLNALMQAVMGGNSEIVQQLLKAGNSAGEGVLGTMLTTVTVSSGWNALMTAVQRNNPEIVQKLLEAGRAAGGDVLGRMLTTVNTGWHPLRLAVMGGNPEIVRQLLEAGAEGLAGEGVLGTMLTTVTTVNEYGWNALAWAVNGVNPEIVRQLLEAGDAAGIDVLRRMLTTVNELKEKDVLCMSPPGNKTAQIQQYLDEYNAKISAGSSSTEESSSEPVDPILGYRSEEVLRLKKENLQLKERNLQLEEGAVLSKRIIIEEKFEPEYRKFLEEYEKIEESPFNKFWNLTMGGRIINPVLDVNENALFRNETYRTGEYVLRYQETETLSTHYEYETERRRRENDGSSFRGLDGGKEVSTLQIFSGEEIKERFEEELKDEIDKFWEKHLKLQSLYSLIGQLPGAMTDDLVKRLREIEVGMEEVKNQYVAEKFIQPN